MIVWWPFEVFHGQSHSSTRIKWDIKQDKNLFFINRTCFYTKILCWSRCKCDIPLEKGKRSGHLCKAYLAVGLFLPLPQISTCGSPLEPWSSKENILKTNNSDRYMFFSTGNPVSRLASFNPFWGLLPEWSS